MILLGQAKENVQKGIKQLQIIYQTKIQYPGHIKKSFNSTIKCQTAQLKKQNKEKTNRQMT